MSFYILQVPGTTHPALWNNICITEKPHWIFKQPHHLTDKGVLHCSFRFQHTKPLVPCRVVENYEGLTILLQNNVRALTEGQFGVLYKDGECLGSAKIKNVCHNLVY